MGKSKLKTPEARATLYMKWQCGNCSEWNIGPLDSEARCEHIFCDMVNLIVSVDGTHTDELLETLWV